MMLCLTLLCSLCSVPSRDARPARSASVRRHLFMMMIYTNPTPDQWQFFFHSLHSCLRNIVIYCLWQVYIPLLSRLVKNVFVLIYRAFSSLQQPVGCWVLAISLPPLFSIYFCIAVVLVYHRYTLVPCQSQRLDLAHRLIIFITIYRIISHNMKSTSDVRRLYGMGERWLTSIRSECHCFWHGNGRECIGLEEKKVKSYKSDQKDS